MLTMKKIKYIINPRIKLNPIKLNNLYICKGIDYWKKY